jgi:PAS domain S-box-containing protein
MLEKSAGLHSNSGANLMAQPQSLRVLHLESMLSDSKLCIGALQNGGLSAEVICVCTAEEFREQLAMSAFDIVLSDYRVPEWTVLDALQLLQAMNVDVPCILVTRSLDDELAAECIKQGVDDYILKDRLARLPVAVCQAIQRKETAAFRSLVGGAPVGIYRSSVSEDRFLTVNPALVAMLGYASSDEVTNLRLSRDVYANSAERMKFLEGVATQDSFIGVELGWKRKDGTSLTVRISGRPIRNLHGKIVIHEVVAEDITQQKSLEQQLWRSQRMEAVGQLAGGVAHDFNNLLMVVNACAELTRQNTSDGRIRKYADQIIAAGAKASLVTRQLLTFSRQQVLDPKTIDLNVLLQDFTKLLAPLISEDIEMSLVTGSGSTLVKVDTGQTEQVVMNLVVNARDAMPNGGELVIETANTEVDANNTPLHPEVPVGHYVTLSVHDTGIGMNEETKARVFEPFFTTKEVGKGTGLGLATVFGIIKQCEGFVSVDSECGQGTTFRIYFPKVEASLQVVRPSVLTSEAIPRGSETVLLVEDEAGVRTITREFLESIGYTVLESGNGAEAFSLVHDHAGPIHAILTDLIMPGLRGSEVASYLQKSHPSARVILMSGHSDRTLNIGESGLDALFLQKPFKLSVLAQKLRAAIDQEQQAA